MPTIHILAPFHTIPHEGFSHCAFTGKAFRFSKMMQAFGYKCVEYANEGSTSEAEKKVVMLSRAEYHHYYQPELISPGSQAKTGTQAWNIYNQRLEAALGANAKVGDIVAHIWTAHDGLVKRFPGLIHVETGIGYPNDAIAPVRIFESEAWRHYHWGRVGSPGGVLPNHVDPARTWVIPNYFDLEDWPLGSGGNAVAFMARFVVDKGIDMLRRIIKAWHQRHPDDDMRFVLAGMGGYPAWLAQSDFTDAERRSIDYRGVVTGRDRAALIGSAKAFLLPSIFVEPFGGSAVEAMLCGTPAITSDFGAFTETVDSDSGWRCRTVDEYVDAIEVAGRLSWEHREHVRERAAKRYCLKVCGAKYHEIFTSLLTRPGAE